MTLSVIIVNWNTGPVLRHCLEAAQLALDGVTSEVIVVDNGSRDGSDRMVELEFPRVRLIRAPRNLGFGRANNLAAQQASGDFLLFLNPDAILAPDAARALLDYATRHLEVGIIGARVLTPGGSVQIDSCGHFLTVRRWLLGRLRIDRLWPATGCFQAHFVDRSGPIDWVSGVCLMIRRALFWRLSGFNPLIFAYCEDMDLCHRAHDIGQATHVVLEAQLVHHQGTAFRTRRASQRSRHLEGELIYVRGHWSGSATASYIALRGLQYLIKMLGEVMRDNRADQQVQSELLTLLTRTGLGFRFRRPVRRP